MKVFIGADHRGFHLKERLKPWLGAQGHQVIDAGSLQLEPQDDYPVISFGLAEKVVEEEKGARGILCCGSGVGAAVAANKVKGVRCGLGLTAKQVQAARHDDDMNILALAADYITEDTAREMVTAFLETTFSNEPRYQRRLDQIWDRENLQ